MKPGGERAIKRPAEGAAPRGRGSPRASAQPDPVTLKSPVKPLRPLLPRPVSTIVSSFLSLRSLQPPPRSVRRRPSGTCGIPQCPRLPCYLNTHRQYAKTLRRTILSHTIAVHEAALSRTSTTSDSSSSSDRLSVRTSPDPEPAFNCLPDLPFETPYPTEFRQILHFFMTVALDRLLVLFRPPMKFKEYKKDVLQQLLSDELFATTCIAKGKFEMLMRSGRRSFESDHIATIIYGLVTKMIRSKLNDLQNTDIDTLLMCVGALANFDSLSMKQDVLANHQTAVSQLVAAKGGVHNLGRSLPYVMQSDVTMAVVLGTHPAFSKPNRDLLPLVRKPPLHYGTAFKTTAAYEADVLLFCGETCHLIDLFERANFSYDTDRYNQGDQQLRPYFLFSRDQLGAEFADLHAQYLREAGKNWCILVAAKIVEYAVVYGNYTIMFTEHLAKELSLTLQEQDLAEEWHGTGKALIWVLWTLVTAPVAHGTTGWAEEMLFDALERKYRLSDGRSGWVVDWAVKEWNLCMQYVWSRKHLRSRFDKFVLKLSCDVESD